MIATSMGRMAIPLMVLILAGGLTFVFAVKEGGHEQRVTLKTAAASPTISKPESGERDRGSAALAAMQAEINAAGASLAGSLPTKESGDGVPAFDIARIEPTGDAVIAGRAAPGAAVELLRNGELHDRAIADESGQFAMIPPRLPPGTYDLTLRSKLPGGKQTTSKEGVAVELEPNQSERPIVALMTPNKPIVVMSKPAEPKPMTSKVILDTVEIEPSGKFYITGRASHGSSVRLYLNDSFIASVAAGADDRFTVTIDKGVTPGNYRVRADKVEVNSGDVQARAEVPFNVAEAVVTAFSSITATSPNAPSVSDSQISQPATLTLPDEGSPSAVIVPSITTTTVSRGDSLWRISRLSYGAGQRYAAIYKANREQIRNPNLIYPGQIFVIPAR